MRVMVAPQEFKGTLTASEAAAAMAEGVRRAAPDATVDVVPLSDGGPGLVDVLVSATRGEVRSARVQDPLGRQIDAAWGVLPDGTAVIDMAAAAGLLLLADAERDPRVTSTRGVGQLVLAALDAGCTRIITGVGGSATNDGGAGMADALGVHFLDTDGAELPSGGAALARLDRIDVTGLDPRVSDSTVVAATDVTNPLCGPEGASLVYGPQKGATSHVAHDLDAALHRYGWIIERDLGIRVIDIHGAGAAGGLGAGLIAFLGAEVRSGFDVVAEAVGLRERIRDTDLVLTGEGRLDDQTAYGKTVARVADLCAELGVPCAIIAGSLGDRWEEISARVAVVEEAPAAPGASPEEAVSQAAERAILNADARR